MRKLLIAPSNMTLSSVESNIYQNILNQATELSLNLMAIKVENRPTEFLDWCQELLTLIDEKLNYDLLEPAQLPVVKKLQNELSKGINASRLRMVTVAPWLIFYQFIEANMASQALLERLKLVDYIYSIKAQPLAQLSELDRLAFAGKHTANHKPSSYPFDVEWFCSTKAAKGFQQILVNEPEAFDVALAHIPLEGEVSKTDYQAFVASYKAAFEKNGEQGTLAPATRLLAMRRPDIFVSLNSAKLDSICLGFNIPKVGTRDFDDYWHQIVQLIMHSPWWRSAQPEQTAVQLEQALLDTASDSIDEPAGDTTSVDNDVAKAQVPSDLEYKVWRARALMVDLFFYLAPNAASQSNYLRLLEKAKNPRHRSSSTAAVSRSAKRTKASAATLVDQALAADDMPEYLLSHRSSLIAQVEKGKSAAEAIALMRAIFG